MGKVKVHKLLDAVIATGSGDPVAPLSINKTFQLFGNTSAGAGAATVLIEGSNDDTEIDKAYVTLDTLALVLNGTTVIHDFGVNNDAWKYVRARCTTLSGTDATITCIIGGQL